MNFYIVSAISFSIFFPGVLAAFNFKKIDHSFYPFIFCLFIGCINEVLSFFLGLHHHSTFLNNNIYVLLESLLLTCFFYRIETIQNKIFWALVLSFLVAWILETFLVRSIFENGTYFRIYASLVIVILSIQQLNRIIFSYKSHLLQNPVFVLCVCFIIYFAYKAMLQSFLIYAWTTNLNFLIKVYDILLYINLGVNLLYTLAVLWMPRRARFILPSL